MNGRPEKLVSLKHAGKTYLFRDAWDYWAYAEVVLANVYWPFALKEDDVVIDLGANIGLFTIHISDRVKKVIAVEPEPSNFRVLERAVKDNSLKNVTLFNMAVSDKMEIVKIDGLSSLAKISEKGQPVQSDSLDAILERDDCKEVNVIKMDIEGYEAKVLKAFHHWKAIREMIIEVHSSEIRNEISELLTGNGFVIKDITDVDYSRIRRNITSHFGSFLAGEFKNSFFLTRKYLRYVFKIGPPGTRPKPGTGGASSGTGVLHAINTNFVPARAAG
ncbi:FkbM family methyltransferase [Nitrososphaera sp.]|uniref:FkbM family methyltransferase n=1 Tax=Nitrososphaera sp. TaxID=1971748 RepID=UPI0017E4A3F3|nr:FkbM family methyltransferase [Nitrososphaera sp.]NWG36461.1 FkbM family methyltransferase [Nitrososphaera sp.]